MATLFNVVAYQCVWLAAVTGAASGVAWAGPAAAAAFAAIQLRHSSRARSDAWLMVACVLVGAALDGSLALGGLVTYAAPTPVISPPIWILSIWAALGLTLRHSLAFLRHRPWTAAAAGALGGPLAYLAAARLGAVSFEYSSLILIAGAWVLAMPLLAWCARDRRQTLERFV